MQNQEDIQPLSHSELKCLRKIYQCGDISPYTNDEGILRRLIELGLIEKVSTIWLPLEMKHDCYQLTPLGHQVMSKCEEN